MSSGDGRAKKEAYFQKLEALLEEYSTIFIVNVDNVGSNQMHQIRAALRGEAVILMGKNTMVRKVLRSKMAENPAYEKLMNTVYGNVGFVFTKGDMKKVRDLITSNRVAAPAKAGAIAPVDVVIPASNTGMGPEKTSFFQALGIATKIARGTIEIVSDVNLITAGTKVGASEAALLNMMSISPFTYGLTIISVYDKGTVFAPEVLDVEDDALIANLLTGIKNIASISLAIGYPTTASVPHSLVNGYKRILGLGLAMEEYSFAAVDKVCSFFQLRLFTLLLHKGLKKFT
jgi:large subunit ribosomal protein LP0